MKGIQKEIAIQIAESLSQVNLYLSYYSMGSEVRLSKSGPFDNKELIKLLSSEGNIAVREYVFQPKGRNFLVRVVGEKVSVSSCTGGLESDAIVATVRKIIEKREDD